MDTPRLAAELVIEHWKLLRSCQRLITMCAPDQQKKAEAQRRYALSRLEQLAEALGLRILEYENTAYTPNLPVSVVNADEFHQNEGLYIEQTLEPTIVCDGRVLFMGKVILREGEAANVSGD